VNSSSQRCMALFTSKYLATHINKIKNPNEVNKMSEKAYEIIEIAKKTGSIKKGTNEVTKAIERGKASFVAYAADVSPKEIVMHLPLLAKEKGIACVEVPSREELGVAAGLGVPAVAVAVIDAGDAKEHIKEFSVEQKQETSEPEQTE
jgi:large subunit ribosomal protein L7Ae